QERHLYGVVDDPPRPLLPRGELFEDVEPPCLGGRVHFPAAPRPVVLVEVAPTAFLERVVAAARPGKGVAELGHGPFYSRAQDVAGPAPGEAVDAGRRRSADAASRRRDGVQSCRAGRGRGPAGPHPPGPASSLTPPP